VSAALEKSVDRAVIRKRRASCPVEVEGRWRERYIPSQQFCFAMVRPADHANTIVHNDEPQQPVRETQTH
jgi:uridine kinase